MRELYEGPPISATGAGMLRKHSSQRPRRAIPTLFLFFSDRDSKHWHCGHPSSSEISRIRVYSQGGEAASRSVTAFAGPAEFCAVEAIVRDMLSAVKPPSRDVVVASC